MMIESDLFLAAPEIVIASMASIILILNRYVSRISAWITYSLTQLTLVIAFILTLHSFGLPSKAIFHNSFIMDDIGNAIKLVLYVYAFFVFIYARKYLFQRDMIRGEYFVLSLFSILGMMVLISARSFITLYLGLELLALPLYALIAFSKKGKLERIYQLDNEIAGHANKNLNKIETTAKQDKINHLDKKAPEAAMKYFVMGALASGMLLYGISILYGVTGSLEISQVSAMLAKQSEAPNLTVLLGLVFVIVGLAFKFGAVPFHMWVPDIYQGSMTSVTLFIGTVPELAAFGMAIRLLQDSFSSLSQYWQPLLIIMAVLSLAIGNIAAIAQTNLKRMLAYSTIGHIGFIFLGLIAGPETGYAAAFAYVIIYSMMALAAFGIIIAISHQGFEAENIKDFQGLGSTQPWAAFLMMLVLFSLAGVPPTIGFYAKFIVLDALLTAGNAGNIGVAGGLDIANIVGSSSYVWLAALAVIFSVIAAFYYLRVIKVMFFEPKPEFPPITERVSGFGMAVLSINGLAMLFFGVYPAPIINFCMQVFAR